MDGNYVISYDGTTSEGWNITRSEMGYMFYMNLENTGYYDTDGFYVGDGNWGLNNTSFESVGPGGPRVSFQNLRPAVYRSGTLCSTCGSPNWYSWIFNFTDGYQGIDVPNNHDYAWAVRDGDVVPIPGALWLLGSGFIGIVGIRKKFKK
jgi:hypothetical protein